MFSYPLQTWIFFKKYVCTFLNACGLIFIKNVPTHVHILGKATYSRICLWRENYIITSLLLAKPHLTIHDHPYAWSDISFDRSVKVNWYNNGVIIPTTDNDKDIIT